MVHCLLSIAHDNADVKRSLSYSKKTLGTDRSTMSFETLSGIRMVNAFVKSMKTDMQDLTIPRDMLQSCKLASSNYRRRKEDEERMKAKTDREKARCAKEEENERKFIEKEKKRLKGDGDILAKKETDLTECRKDADQLLSDGNTLLTNGIKEEKCSSSTRHVGCS